MIRLANEKDIERLVFLRLEYFKEAYEVFPEDKKHILEGKLSTYFSEHLNKDCFAVVFERGGEISSCGLLNILGKAPNLRNLSGKYGEIYGVYTLPECRRNGNATAIIEFIKSIAVRQECSFLMLEASKEGIGVYKKCGFKIDNFDYVNLKLFL